jgi:nucleoside-diphosphate-sugar epimerase
MEIVWKLLRLKSEPLMTRFVASQLAGSHSYSIHAAETDFGYKPLFTMQEGLKRLADDIDRMKTVTT